MLKGIVRSKLVRTISFCTRHFVYFLNRKYTWSYPFISMDLNFDLSSGLSEVIFSKILVFYLNSNTSNVSILNAPYGYVNLIRLWISIWILAHVWAGLYEKQAIEPFPLHNLSGLCSMLWLCNKAMTRD